MWLVHIIWLGIGDLNIWKIFFDDAKIVKMDTFPSSLRFGNLHNCNRHWILAMIIQDFFHLSTYFYKKGEFWLF